MKTLYLLLFSFLLIAGLQSVRAQSDALVTINQQDGSMEDFVRSLERQSSLRFYYDQADFDSLKISLSATNKPVRDVLDEVLKPLDAYSTFYGTNSVFITKNKSIVTELPSQYLPDRPKKEPVRDFALADLESGRKEAAAATLENKVYTIGSAAGGERGNATLAGYIRSAKTGEPISGAAIYIASPRIGTATNQFGFYSLTLPKGKHELLIRAIGVRDTRRQVLLYADGKLDINVQEQLLSLKEVVISADKASNIRNVQMGVEKLDIKTIKQVPTVFGEADVLRVVLTLPGVKSVGESSTGFNVRGGAVDQNLILFNDATVYNPSHFFGFFSAFNPEVIKDVQLYKSSIPAKFGGRLSSVLELTSREGNKKEIAGSAGLGLLTSRVNVEGPIIKDKTSFILGGRMTYSNWLLRILPEKAGYKDAKAGFYDLNLNVSHEQNTKNSFYLTGYLSNDNSNLASDTSYSYLNQNLSLKWKHAYTNKLHSVLTTGFDKYQYQNYSNYQDDIAYKLRFHINQANFKADFNYYLSPKHTFDFGLQSIYYRSQPGNLQPYHDRSLIVADVIAKEQALETAAYFGERFDLSPSVSFNLGLRYSLFNNFGPATTTLYAAGLPKNEGNIVGTKTVKKGEIAKTYHGPEYRLAARFALSPDFSIKTSYNSLRQYIHMLSNTTSMSPTDVWKLSDLNVKPQRGDQFSLGLYKNFKSNTIETSVEGYYKRLNDYLDYKSGATLVLNHHIEQDVINTRGKAYGVEFLVKKLTGKVNGWVSYTYSRTFLKTDEVSGSESVNRGNFYPSNHDKPHDLTLISNYRFSHRYSFSFNATYSTGRPITLPIGKYTYMGGQRVLYSDRNAYRIPDYFRTDISLNIEGNHKVKQLTHNSWTFGIYNLTARKNAFASYFATENGAINGYKLSIFGTAIPFVNYNIRF
ncbi:TonB-dependent receptor [Pedobacter sp. SYSU D00535]|uniref:TonB-dependent receptor n=1 Tax=Pedobacter sp. SYSU D00535 TaxID=2810308 RepID=UPI001A97A043|nr:TonB-dependent receptor [Pedobacter sp. SYSU D00535]